MTDDIKLIRQILSEEVDKLPLDKYIQRELETINLQTSFTGKEMSDTDKKVWSWLMGFTKRYADAMAVTIARLKTNGFFT